MPTPVRLPSLCPREHQTASPGARQAKNLPASTETPPLVLASPKSLPASTKPASTVLALLHSSRCALLRDRNPPFNEKRPISRRADTRKLSLKKTSYTSFFKNAVSCSTPYYELIVGHTETSSQPSFPSLRTSAIIASKPDGTVQSTLL